MILMLSLKNNQGINKDMESMMTIRESVIDEFCGLIDVAYGYSVTVDDNEQDDYDVVIGICDAVSVTDLHIDLRFIKLPEGSVCRFKPVTKAEADEYTLRDLPAVVTALVACCEALDGCGVCVGFDYNDIDDTYIFTAGLNRLILSHV